MDRIDHRRGDRRETEAVRKKMTVVFLGILVFLLSFSSGAVSAFAAGGDGSGSGGGSSVALAMVSSTPSDGASGVSTTPVISCRFSHNVAEASVSSANLSHLSLRRADGTSVPLRTYVADVQIEFDKRQYLYAEPVSALETGTTYTLTLSAGIQAKNGMTTSSAQTVTFTTAGSPPSQQDQTGTSGSSGSSATSGASGSSGSSGTAGTAGNSAGTTSGQKTAGTDASGISGAGQADGNGAETDPAEDGTQGEPGDEDGQGTGGEDEEAGADAAEENGNSPKEDAEETSGGILPDDYGNGADEADSTAVRTAVIIILIVLLAAGIAAAVFRKKRQRKKQKK